jgi:hypothetical protein
MRRILVTLAAVAAVAAGSLTVVPVAHAAVDVTLDSVTVAPPKAGRKANVIVKATLAQQQYADISVDVTLSGFEASGTFPFRDGPCPAKLVQVTVPAEVIQCGWTQNGTDAVLSMAISGTFPTSGMQIKVRKGSVRTPARPGAYKVTLSSWAFSAISDTVTVK